MTIQTSNYHYFVKGSLLKKFEKEAIEGNPSSLINLFEKLGNPNIKHPFIASKPKLCHRCFKIIESNNIPFDNKLLKKVIRQFAKFQVFSKIEISETVALRSREGEEVFFNSTLLRISFDYFKPNCNEPGNSEAPSLAVLKQVKEYIYSNTFSLREISTIIECYQFSHKARLKSLEDKCVHAILKYSKTIKRLSALENLFKDLQNPEFDSKREILYYEIALNFLKKNGYVVLIGTSDTSSKKFYLDIQSLGLLDKSKPLTSQFFQQYLRGIYVDNIDEESFSLLSYMPESLRHEIDEMYHVNLPSESFLERISALFPNLKVITYHLKHNLNGKTLKQLYTANLKHVSLIKISSNYCRIDLGSIAPELNSVPPLLFVENNDVGLTVSKNCTSLSKKLNAFKLYTFEQDERRTWSTGEEYFRLKKKPSEV